MEAKCVYKNAITDPRYWSLLSITPFLGFDIAVLQLSLQWNIEW